MERAGYYKEAWRTFPKFFSPKNDLPENPRGKRSMPNVAHSIKDSRPGENVTGTPMRKSSTRCRTNHRQNRKRLIPLFQRSFPNCFFIGSNETARRGYEPNSLLRTISVLLCADTKRSNRCSATETKADPRSVRKPRGIGPGTPARCLPPTLRIGHAAAAQKAACNRCNI